MIRNTILLLLIIFISSNAFAIDFEGKNAIGFKALKFIIQSGCKTAIKIAEKV